MPLIPIPVTANTAVLCATLGVCLVFLECNRPGSIFPGAFGATLVLLSVPALLRGPHHLWASLLLLAAAVLLSLPLRSPVPLPVTLLSGLLLLAGLRGLLIAPPVGWLPALLSASLLTSLATPLAHAARRSRTAKRTVHQSR